MRHSLRPVLLALALGLLPGGAAPAAEDLAPATYQQALAALVANVLTTEHYAAHALDDELSERWFDGYLEMLDYNRMFFLASDIASFGRWKDTLDDAARTAGPDLQIAFDIHEVYRQRVSERVAQAMVLLDQPIDFTVDESFDLDRSDDPWPANEDEARELWRKRIKEQVLRGMLRGETQESQVEMLRRRYRRLETDILATEPADVLEPYLASFAHAFDPHSDYFKPSTNEDFDIQMSNSLEGIGATLRTEGEYTLVVSLVPGGPAQLGGDLQAGDKIVAVAQGSEPAVDVVDERIDKVVKLIRGPKGTEVRLTVIPVDAPDPSHTREVRIVRDQVILTADDAESRVIEMPGADGQPLKIGVIDIPSFYQDFQAKRGGDPNFKSTTRDVRSLLTELEAQGVSGVILDVRRNGGGSLDEAVDLTGLFIPQGPVVQIGDRSGRTEAMYDPDPKLVYGGPLMVLTSPLSASASEILAGAIQDYDRGLIVGSASTHGKGTVQNVIELDPVLRRFVRYPGKDDIAGAVKVTTHKFYRVSGGSTQLRGVQADVVLPSPFDGLELLESDLDYALPWDRVAPLAYHEMGDLDSTAERLQAISAERVANDPEFTELMEAIAKRTEADGKVSLSLETRKKELESFGENALDEDQADDEGEDHGGDDMILDEATRIMRDWLAPRVTQAQPG